MGYNIRVITLDSQPKYIPFNVKYVDVITSLTTADLSKVKVSVDDGPQVPLNDFVPIPIPVRQMVLNWEASETGKKIAFLMVDTPIMKIKQSVTLLNDESGIKADLDSIDTKLDVNLSTRASEATLSALKNALASVGTDKVLTTPDNPPNLDIALSSSKVALPSAIKSAKVSISGGTAGVTQALFSTSTPSKRAYILRDSSDTGTVYIGDSTSQDYPLNPGDRIETYIDDLNKIYVNVPAGVTANIYVLYES